MIKVRGKAKNYVWRTYHTPLTIHTDGELVTITSTRTYMHSEICTYDCIYQKDIVAMWSE